MAIDTKSTAATTSAATLDEARSAIATRLRHHNTGAEAAGESRCKLDHERGGRASCKRCTSLSAQFQCSRTKEDDRQSDVRAVPESVQD